MGKYKFSSVYCYTAKPDSSLTLYVDSDSLLDKETDSTRVVIEASDVSRLMYAALDALQKKESYR